MGQPVLARAALIYCIVIGRIHLLLAMRSYQFTPNLLNMYELNIKSNINSRYVYTTIIKRLENRGEAEQNITYSVVFPEEAFVSGFILEVDGKNYTAFITGRMEDKLNEVNNPTYNQTEALHERGTNKFSLPITVKSKTKVAFYLMYEQMLKRENGRYEHIINIKTDEIIPNFNIEVQIGEKSNLIHLNAATRVCSENECKDIPIESNELWKNTNNATVIKPNLSTNRQLGFTRLVKSSQTKGFSGQFVVQYDVERNLRSGSILINNGYCVHFFSPGLSQLSKYVVFILDTSLSMRGQRLNLLKNAMIKIFEKLDDHDFFSIVEFNTNVKVWNLEGRAEHYPSKGGLLGPTKEVDFKYFKFPKAHEVNANNILRAKSIVSKLKATGNTDIYSALKVGLHLVELSRNMMYNNTKPFIIFLTDGEPISENQISKDDIVENISQYNTGLRTSSIFTLAFGTEPDYHFLEKLAKRNGGYAKRIYDASDASLQLQDFFQLISTPILTNVTFQYGTAVTNLTQTHFSTLFNGSELVVAGYCGKNKPSDVTINGWNNTGEQIFNDCTMESTQADVKRMWVYITISQLLDEAVREEKKQIEILRKAYELALANSFATYVTSVVVPTPDNSTTVVNPQARRRDISTASFPSYTPPPFVDKDDFIDNTETSMIRNNGLSKSFFPVYFLLSSSVIIITRTLIW